MINRRVAIAGLAAVGALCCGGRPTSRGDDGSAGPIQYRYGPDPSQFAEIYLPATGSAPVPVVVVIHGGFWLSGFGLSLGRPLASDLSNRGLAAVNVEYRRVGPSSVDGGGWPQTGRDVAAAVDALADEGQRLSKGRLDLSKVVALGHSAGGQLAVWLAARGADATVPVNGVVSQAGMLDLVTAAEQGVGGGAVEDLMGGPPSVVPRAYADASPLARVPLGFPSVCVHGVDDDVVPIAQSERFVAAAVQAGDKSELLKFDGGHFEPINVHTAAYALCLQSVQRLLATRDR